MSRHRCRTISCAYPRRRDDICHQKNGLCLVTNVRNAQCEQLVGFVSFQSHEELGKRQFQASNQNSELLSSSQTSINIMTQAKDALQEHTLI